MELRIGIFGAGIVGGGVIDLVQKLTENGRFNELGNTIQIIKVCVKSIEKERDIKLNKLCKIVTNYDEILMDESINCIVEVMGGTTDAKYVVFKAIEMEKHVITANKALVATFLPDIQIALNAKPHVRFCFEGAVCGGIPIIHTLHSAFLCDKVTKIAGIMNGTTNFMLCKMEDEGADYQSALKEAQQLGFAEADPTADVEGHDVQAKIALLVKLSFGRSVDVGDIRTEGISKLTSSDFVYAKSIGYTIKLLGTASVNNDDSLAVFVAPTLVPLSSPFSTAKGPGNMVIIRSENMSVTTLSGPGAGRYPTANSILSDLLRLARGETAVPFPLSSDRPLNSDYVSRFYMRVTCRSDVVGFIGLLADAAVTLKVVIKSISQVDDTKTNTSTINSNSTSFVIITSYCCSYDKIHSLSVEMTGWTDVMEVPFFMPML